MVASMDGIVYHNLHSQPLCITPSSLTHKRGLKRSAPDSDDLQRPTADNHHALSQLPAPTRVITGMLATIPQSVWDYGSNLVYGLVDLFSSRHAPPAQQQAAQQHAASSQPTHITGVATDRSDRKRRAVDTSPVNGSPSTSSLAHTSPTTARVRHIMPFTRKRVPGTSAAAVPTASSAANDRNSAKEAANRAAFYRAYNDPTLSILAKKLALSRTQRLNATTAQPTTVDKSIPIKDRQISGLIHKAHKAQGVTTAQRALQQKKAAEEQAAAEQAAAEKQAADIAAAEEAARIESEKQKALIAAEEEKKHLAAKERDERDTAARVASNEADIKEHQRRAAELPNSNCSQTVVEVSGLWWEEIDECMGSKLRDRDTVIQIGSIPLQKITFKRILSFDSGTDSWLDDDSVNAWYDLIVGNKNGKAGYVKSPTTVPPFANLQTAWFAKFNKEKAKGLKRWMKRAGIGGANMLKCERIFLPINAGSHWTLLIINGVNRSIEYLDSLGGDGKRYFQIARELLASELGDMYLEKEWTDLKRNRSFPQSNMNDCGVFTCMNGLAAAMGRPYKDVQARMMENARRLMASVFLNGGFDEVLQL